MVELDDGITGAGFKTGDLFAVDFGKVLLRRHSKVLLSGLYALPSIFVLTGLIDRRAFGRIRSKPAPSRSRVELPKARRQSSCHL